MELSNEQLLKINFFVDWYIDIKDRGYNQESLTAWRSAIKRDFPHNTTAIMVIIREKVEDKIRRSA